MLTEDRVMGTCQGAYAEQVAVPWKLLLRASERISMEQACGIASTYPTSYEALVGRAHAKEGEWVLALAAAGAVGIAAVQIAKYLGCKVVAAIGSMDKAEACRRAGADHVVSYTADGWQDEVKRLSDGGVDVVYDPVGEYLRAEITVHRPEMR